MFPHLYDSALQAQFVSTPISAAAPSIDSPASDCKFPNNMTTLMLTCALKTSISNGLDQAPVTATWSDALAVL